MLLLCLAGYKDGCGHETEIGTCEAGSYDLISTAPVVFQRSLTHYCDAHGSGEKLDINVV
jgi:hypothetical protein